MKSQKLFAAILCAVTPLAYAATDVLDEIVVTATRIAQPLKRGSVRVCSGDDGCLQGLVHGLAPPAGGWM